MSHDFRFETLIQGSHGLRVTEVVMTKGGEGSREGPDEDADALRCDAPADGVPAEPTTNGHGYRGRFSPSDFSRVSTSARSIASAASAIMNSSVSSGPMGRTSGTVSP